MCEGVSNTHNTKHSIIGHLPELEQPAWPSGDLFQAGENFQQGFQEGGAWK